MYAKFRHHSLCVVLQVKFAAFYDSEMNKVKCVYKNTNFQEFPWEFPPIGHSIVLCMNKIIAKQSPVTL